MPSRLFCCFPSCGARDPLRRENRCGELDPRGSSASRLACWKNPAWPIFLICLMLAAKKKPPRRGAEESALQVEMQLSRM